MHCQVVSRGFNAGRNQDGRKQSDWRAPPNYNETCRAEMNSRTIERTISRVHRKPRTFPIPIFRSEGIKNGKGKHEKRPNVWWNASPPRRPYPIPLDNWQKKKISTKQLCTRLPSLYWLLQYFWQCHVAVAIFNDSRLWRNRDFLPNFKNIGSSRYRQNRHIGKMDATDPDVL